MMTKSEPKITVSRDGVVTRDGENIGHVQKEMRQGIFGTLLGASYSGSGTPYWTPFAADGTQLSEYGYDTRKRAVQRLADHAEPMTVSGLQVSQGGLMSDWSRRFVECTLRFQGHSFGVSRYATESAWVVDFYWSPDSIMPNWSNGSGTRVTRANVLKDEAASFVTKAATEAGLWPMAEEKSA
jgi:hypothetical protein